MEDERLLVDIVAFLNGHFDQPCPESERDDQDLRWIMELLLNQVGWRGWAWGTHQTHTPNIGLGLYV